MAYNLLVEHAANEETALRFLQQNLLLRSEPPDCTVCGRQMTLVRCGRGDDKCFRCPSHKGEKVFLAKDTFFENSQLTCKNIVHLLFSWSVKEPIVNSVFLTGLSENTVIQWFAYFRDICSRWLIDNPQEIGGIGQHVEIDESLIAKRKNNVGRVVEQRWVFGGVDRATRQGFLVLVPDRTRGTLEHFIQQFIAPGSIINSDGFASYNNIVNLNVQPRYQHIVVNHNRNFVDPATGACTNLVENYWKNAKRRFKAMSGTNQEMLPGHLDKFMWRQKNGKTPQAAFNSIIEHLAHYYAAP